MMKATHFKVVCVGLACLDYLFWQSDKKPSGVEKAIAVMEWLAQGGGMAATAAVTAARLGAEVKLITKIGDNEIGKRVLQELKKENVKLDEFSQIKDAKTPVDFVNVMPDGSRKFHYYPGKGLERPLPKGISADVLLVDKAFPKLSLKAAKIASQKGIKVVADLEEKIGKEEKEILKFVQYALLDEEAAKDIDPDLSKALRKLAKKVEFAAVTRGEMGVSYCSNGKIKHQPPFDIKVIDSTGAGDAFHGAYAYALANKWPLEKSIRFSSAVGALACRKLGGRSALPTLKEVKEFLDEQS